MEDRKFRQFRIFHKMIAVVLTLLMVVSVIPFSESEAAKWIVYYSGRVDNFTREGAERYLIKDIRNKFDVVPRQVTGSDYGQVIFYHNRSKGKAVMGTTSTLDGNRNSRYQGAVTTDPKTNTTAENYTFIYKGRDVCLSRDKPGSNSSEYSDTLTPVYDKSSLSLGSPKAYVNADVEIPVKWLKEPGYRLANQYVDINTFCADTHERIVTTPSGASYFTLPQDWWLKDTISVTLRMTAISNLRHCYGWKEEGYQTNCIAELVSGNTWTTGNLTLQPEYEKVTDTYLTYQPNGGVGAPYTQGPYTGDGTVSAPVDDNTNCGFTRDHYAFDGWNTSANGKGTAYDPSKNPTVNMMYDLTLYAQWRQTEFQVSYDANGADTGYANVPKTEGWYGKDIAQNSFTVEDGNTEELPLKKSGMVFDGWNTEANGSGKAYKAGDTFTVDDTITENITLYAQWKTAPKHNLLYDNGGEEGTMDSTTLYNDGIPANTIVTVRDNAFTSSKYSFLEWERDDDENLKYQPGDTFSFNMDKENETLTARWGAALTYDKNGSDVLNSVPTDSKIYDFQNGEKAKALGNPGRLLRPEHIFSGWDDEAGDTADRAGNYQKDDEITFTQNKTVYAHWRPADKFHVNYALNPPEGVNEEQMQGALPEDTHTYFNDELDDVITLRQPSMMLPGYRFDGWLDETGRLYKPGKQYHIHADTPKEITFSAKWVPAKTYSVTYDANLDKGEELQNGSVPTDTKSPYYNDLLHDKIKVLDHGDMERKGYQFAGWNTEKDGSGDSYQKDDEFHVTRYSTDITLYAQWQKELTITGLTPDNRVYNGYSAWDGKIEFAGKKTGDSVTIKYRNADYHDENGPSAAAGDGKTIIAEDLYLAGADADKYVIKDSTCGIYNMLDKTLSAPGSISKRKITIAPSAARTFITVGDVVPDFSYDVIKGSLASTDGKSESVFGKPVYGCTWEKDPSDSSKNVELIPGTPAAEASTNYRFTVKGLANDNYDITFEESRFTVNPPGSTPVRITYKEGVHGLGTPPADTNTYYIYDDPVMNSEAAVIGQGSLYSPGCVFAGWNIKEDGSGVMTRSDGTTTKLLQAGDSIKVAGNTTLYAIWKGNTPLTITGLTNKTKVYDGTTDWTGSVTVKKADPKDEVGIAFTKAGYDTKNAGQGKAITLEGISLAGADSYKYKLADGGMYSQKSDTITINSGEITRRPITVEAQAVPSSITKGDPVPVLDASCLHTADNTSLAGGDSLAADFGTPVFTCEDGDGNALSQNSPAGNYVVHVSGLSNDNYDISYKTSVITAAGADGEVEVRVSYDLNGGSGLPPVDLNKYYVYPDTSKNSIATVLPETAFMKLNGCKFAGWNTSADGSAVITKPDGTSSNRLQAGDSFKLQGNTTLYAMWEPDRELKIAGITGAQKTYDNSDIWNGKILLDGVEQGDDVEVTYANGKFSMKDAGNRFISASDLKITGRDAYKYHLTEDSAGIYQPLTNSILYTGGEILKRPITIGAKITSANPAECDKDEPEYGYELVKGTFADGEDITVLDQTNVVYSLTDKNGGQVLWQDIHEAGSYQVNVSGLAGDNYDISYEQALLRVFDEEKTPAYVIYHADNATGGTVPVDPTEYMVYADPKVEKPQAEILGPGDLERAGYRFAGWKNRDTGKIVEPGKKIAVTDMIHLEAVWEGNTPIKITGLTNNKKVYDGKDIWNGSVIVEGILPGDDLKITYTDGKFADRNAGEVPVRAAGITISGADADKYVIQSTDVYDMDENVVIVKGEIDPLEMTVQPIVRGFDANQAVLKQGEDIPDYELYLPATSKIITPDELKDFGEPEYECKKYDGEALAKGSAPGYYRLSVQGLSHRNYDVNAEATQVQVWAPGMKKVHVTYRPGGGHGIAPLDKNDYAVFDNPVLNSKVTVLENTFTRDGYRFIGWSTKPDGSGTLRQPGEVFRITGDTVLYAAWKKVPVKQEDDKKGPQDEKENGGTNRPEENENGPADGSEEGGSSPDSMTNAEENAKDLSLTAAEAFESGKGEKKSHKDEDSYSFGKERISNRDSSARYIFEDDKVPLGQRPGGWKDGSHKSGVFGRMGECSVHWIILLCTILLGGYAAVRRRYIKRKQPRENFILDKVIPLTAIPLGVVFHYLTYCVLDVFAVVLLLTVSAAGAFLIHRAYDDGNECESTI